MVEGRRPLPTPAHASDILCRAMTDEPTHSSIPPVETPVGQGAPEAPPDGGAAVPRDKRRKWIRRVANLLIVAGVLAIPAYYGGTCACTAIEQNRLREDLEAANPQLAVAEEALTSGGLFVVETSTTTTTIDPDATVEEIDEVEAAIAAAKAERDAKLAAFKAAATEYALTVSGKIGEPVGKILIPKIGVDVVVVEGTSVRDLKEGPGHWEETPYPGQGGNFVVSGHRTTYGAPFFKLNELEPGDHIDLVLPYAVVRYAVTSVFIVYPDEVETVAQKGREQISLAACHPIYSAKQRIVAQGELVSFKLIEPEAVTPSAGG